MLHGALRSPQEARKAELNLSYPPSLNGMGRKLAVIHLMHSLVIKFINLFVFSLCPDVKRQLCQGGEGLVLGHIS